MLKGMLKGRLLNEMEAKDVCFLAMLPFIAKPVAKVLLGILLFFIVVALVFVFILGFDIVSTSAMAPTIPQGSIVVYNRQAYRFSNPERRDIVVINRLDTNKKESYRIIGISGDTILIQDGEVWRNNVNLKEPYTSHATEGNNTSITIPQKFFVVMGDNRKASTDSRHWEDPLIYEKEIKGKLLFVIRRDVKK